MKANSPLDSAVIAEGNEADNDGNEDEDCNDDDKPEDEGRSHNIIINTTYITALYIHLSTHTQPPPPHTHPQCQLHLRRK